ncbi:hypothetical protein [Nocardia farcinica]|uniref:hypothetical protein n=1 Tax=Nocardia farcinica TaxID=37329 RepID=UPI002453786F|nr:hypothetical protein [Nocardia farcinica]
MTPPPTADPDLIVSGRPASTHLRDVRTISRRMVGHFVENVVPCGTLPGDALAGDVTAVTRACLELTMRMLDGHEIGENIDEVAAAAAGGARGGVGVPFWAPPPRAGVALTRLVTRAMVARPFRPLLLAMMSGTDDYELPSYATDSADRR